MKSCFPKKQLFFIVVEVFNIHKRRKLSIFMKNTDMKNKVRGWMYILLCSDGSYYTGSTNNLERRILQHQKGEGSNHTKKRLPVRLIYFEEYERIDLAFYREKQVQGWNRKKKEALINGSPELLPQLAIAYRDMV